MILDEYILKLPCIGEGTYGQVFLTTKRDSNGVFATKKIEKSKVLGEKLRQYFLNEIEILNKVNHPNIMKLIEIKSTHNNLYLITEYCNGGTLTENLAKYQKNYKIPFPEKIVIHFMRQIAEAINYLHSERIIHRDLKTDNILLHFENEEDKKQMNFLKAKIKIIDFGFARMLNDNTIASSIVGSPLNMAPDILHALADEKWRSNLRYDEKADIYSIGVIMFILLIGKAPFNAGDYKDLFSKVNTGIYTIPKDLKLSMECISCMNSMMMQDPNKRYSVVEVLKSDFLTKKYEDFEFIDFSNIDSNPDSKFNVQHSGNLVFLDIKKIVNYENKKSQQGQTIANGTNINVIINDMNKKDDQLENLLDKINPKRDPFNVINVGLPKPDKEVNVIAYNDNSKPVHSQQQHPNIILIEKKVENIKLDYPNIPQIQNPPVINVNNINNQNVKNNYLIDLNKYPNIAANINNQDVPKQAFYDKNYVRDNSGPNITALNNLLSIPSDKLDNVFNLINKKFEVFEMEAMPLYIENPKKYENYIL